MVHHRADRVGKTTKIQTDKGVEGEEEAIHVFGWDLIVVTVCRQGQMPNRPGKPGDQTEGMEVWLRAQR